MKHSYLDIHAGIASPIHALDARAKILAFGGLVIVSVSTPPHAYVAFAGYLVFLAAILAFSRVPVGFVLQRSLAVIPFVVVVAIFIPFLANDAVGGGYNLGIGGLTVSRSGALVLWNVVVKSYIGVVGVILLSSTTPFPKLLQGLEQLRVPRVFVLLGSFAYRYIFLLVDEVQRMKRARDSRAFGGRWIWHAHVVGDMIGTLFLRSYERSERVYVAMVSRGFDGQIRGLGESRFAARDAVFVAASLAILLSLRLGAP